MALRKFNESPYYDDYSSDNSFYKILYRPGHAVQARELNQVQTMSQKQLSIFADAIFDNGANVQSGEIKLDNNLSYIKIDENFVQTDLSLYVGATVSSLGDSQQATIVSIEIVDGSDPTTIYLSYKNSDSASNDASFSNSQNVIIKFDHITTSSIPDEAITISSLVNSTGVGTALYLTSGIYYSKGYFVSSDKQTIIVSKYSNSEEIDLQSIGFVIVEKIVTPEQDISLLDNATGAPNQTAPGAHRFKINLSLTKKSDLSGLNIDESDYIEIAKIIRGRIQKPLAVNEYSLLEDVLATRTYEESGDYIIDDFSIELKEHLNDGNNNGLYTAPNGGENTKIGLILGEGKAYIKGYQLALTTNTFSETDKARSTSSIDDIFLATQQGSYMIVDNVIRTPELFDSVELKEGVSVIGSAIITAFSYDSPGKYKIYLSNIDVNTGKTLVDVDNFAQNGVSFTADVVTNGELVRSNETSKIFSIPFGVIENIDGAIFSKYEKFISTVNSDVISLSTSSNQQFKDEIINYIVELPTGGTVSIPDSVVITSGDNTQVDINIASMGSTNGESVEVIAEIRKTNLQPKTKSVVSSTDVIPYTVDRPEIVLSKHDGISLSSITYDDGSNVNDYTSHYSFFDGQTDSSYENIKLKLNTGYSDPGVPLTIEYTYFSHSTGDFFSAQSYPGNLESVPLFDGVRLSNTIDFRPKSTIGQSSVGGVSFVPDNEIQLDFTYFLSRIDIITLDKTGKFNVVKGIPDVNPLAPNTPENAIRVYTILIPAYTFSIDELNISKDTHRRYTMRDINSIENRIKSLEYYSSLNLLESDAANKEFINKFKSGFVVDNFKTQNVGYASHPDFKIAIDPVLGELRPEANIKATELQIDSAISSHYTLHPKGSIITLPYSEKIEIEQSLASRTERLNPFLKFNWIGDMTISPSSDYWVTNKLRPDTIIDNGVFETVAFRQNKNNLGTVWGAWNTSFVGESTTEFIQNRYGVTELAQKTYAQEHRLGHNGNSGLRYITTKDSTFKDTKRGTSLYATETISTKFVGSKVISESVIPYMRGRNISFSVSGLKPYTQMYLFFDGILQDHHTTSSTNMIVDTNGDLSGVYSLPSSDEEKFRTGVKQISVSDSVIFSNKDIISFATAKYAATGIIKERSNIFTSTKIIDLGISTVADSRTRTESITTTGGWFDPVAQSFMHSLNGGGFFTSIDVFFKKYSTGTEPVTCQIREMINGYPGPAIIPGSSVTLGTSSINGSDDATVSTKFTFDYPLYLDENKEYCFVLITNSENLEVWISKVGDAQRLAGDTTKNSGEQISKQPYLGSMFKSQNNKTWTASQFEDIKFSLRRAVFDHNTDGIVNFENKTRASDIKTDSDSHYIKLDESPIELFSGSSVLKIHHLGHGFAPGDTVKLFSKEDSGIDVGGIPRTEIFNSHIDSVEINTGTILTIDSDIDVDWYKVTVASNATSTGIFGTNIFSTQNISFSIANFITEDIVVNDTSISYGVKSFDKYTNVLDSTFTPFVPKEDLGLGVSKKIKESGSGQLLVNAVLHSDKDNVSPIIDEDRFGVICVENRINNKNDDSTNDSVSRYFLKDNLLINAADQLNIYFDINRPSGTDVDVYYKAQPATDLTDFSDISWVKMTATSTTPVSDDISNFDEYNYEKPIGFDFTKFSVKIVMKSSNEAKVPVVKNFRTIALKS